MYKNFEELLQEVREKHASPKVAVVAGANDEHVLEAVFMAQEMGIVTPLLVGVPDKITEIINELGYLDKNFEIVAIDEGDNPSAKAVALVKIGRGDFIIKGKMETRDLLKPILDKEIGLNKTGFITHFGYMQLKGYHKLLAISDCAVIPYPSFDDKVKIIKAGVSALEKLGYTQPVIGALCAVETINKKMPETLEAQQLQEMSEMGDFGKAKVIGPISYDLATRKESAEIKGYDSPYAGEVDMLLVPNLVTGNVMSKIWNADADNVMAGCLVGADVPIVLTSRSASMSEKLNSILLCTKLC
ncbi:MAG: phosphate acyltransferase [Suipraeoptans sp.]